MIRPFTLVCMLSAFGAGLYLYQSKHQAQMLDREIGRTIKLTESVRERTGMLRAEWALLNEPDRLNELAKAHTSLQTLKPTQFVGLSDLAARLPAPMANNRERLPVDGEPEDAPAVPVAQAAPPVVVTPPVKPREVVATVEPKPKPDPKPVVRHVETNVVVAAATPVQAQPAPVRPRPQPPAEFTNSDATAPGTVGAAVLRAMQAQNVRAQNGGSAYAQAASAQPAYGQPAYGQPAYTQPTYAAPAPSVLGGRALAPPVPFAAR